MTNTTMTALFDTRAEAERAQLELLNRGLRKEAIVIIDQGAASVSRDDGPKGFWDSVRDFFIPDADGHTFAEGVRRGAFLLIARVEDEGADDVIELLENSDAVDLDTRSREWQAQGWTPYEAEAAASGASISSRADPSPNVERTATHNGFRVRAYANQQPSELPPRSMATEPVAVKNFSGQRTRGIDEASSRSVAASEGDAAPDVASGATNADPTAVPGRTSPRSKQAPK
jgi:hypothetical protein